MNRKGIGYYLRIYRKILVQDIKSKMSYRADFIISMVGMVSTSIAGAASLWLVFKNFPSIAGWNFYEMMFLYGFTLISATPAQCLFDNNWNLRMAVYTGDFIKYCFRPMNLFFYFMSEIFDLKGIWQFFFGVGTIIYAWNKLQIPFHPGTFLLFLVAALSASLFTIAILNLAASSCFWLVHSFFVLQFANTLRDFANYPITIFGRTLRIVFTFLMPVGFIAYYPSLLFLRPSEVTPIVYLTPVLGIAFFYLSYKVWMKGALSYDGTGN